MSEKYSVILQHIPARIYTYSSKNIYLWDGLSEWGTLVYQHAYVYQWLSARVQQLHWSYCSLELSHRYISTFIWINFIIPDCITDLWWYPLSIKGNQGYLIEAETKWAPFCRQHFQTHFINENCCILIKISLKFVPKGPINNIPAFVQIMVWRQSGDKPLSEPMMVLFNEAYMRHSASMSFITSSSGRYLIDNLGWYQ